MSLPLSQVHSTGPVSILEYDRGQSEPAIAARWRRAVYLALVLPAAVTPFVSFTYDVSPASVVWSFLGSVWQRQFDQNLGMLILIAAPFLLGVPTALRALRLLIAAPDTRGERIVALCLAVASALMTVSFFAWGIYNNPPTSWLDRETLIAAIGPAIIFSGGLLIIALARFQPKSHAIVPTALHVAYLANAWICLIEFSNDRQIGGWLALISAIAMSLHLGLVFSRLVLHIWRRN
jgi:hypothetical protein